MKRSSSISSSCSGTRSSSPPTSCASARAVSLATTFVTGIDGYPFIFEVVKEENETVNFGGNWHSDTTYLRQPPLATLLYALETPTHGGDTLFANTPRPTTRYRSMRALVDKLIGVNSASLLVMTGGRRKLHAQTSAA